MSITSHTTEEEVNFHDDEQETITSETITAEPAAQAIGRRSRRSTVLALIIFCGLALSIVIVWAMFGGVKSLRQANVPVGSRTTVAETRTANQSQSQADEAIASLKTAVASPSTSPEAAGGATATTTAAAIPLQRDPLGNPIASLNQPIYAVPPMSGYAPNQPVMPISTNTEGGAAPPQQAATSTSATGGATGGTQAHEHGGTSSGTSDSTSGGINEHADSTNASRNNQSSIYYFNRSLTPPDSTAAAPAASFSPVKTDNAGGRIWRSREVQETTNVRAPVKPPFGTMLPVRTLGALYTLRNGGLARLELTRSVRGQNWSMARGTVLVGRVAGGENDRAYVNLVGFIDPASNRLVPITGEAVGIDGATGLRGARKHVGSTWAKALRSAAQAGVGLGSAYLGGRNGGSYFPQSRDIYGSGNSSASSSSSARTTDFVMIPASTQGYAMITDLPPTAEGANAMGDAVDNDDGSAASGRNTEGGEISDDELMRLVTVGTPEQIRAALPRMNQRLRAVAEKVLAES